MILYLSMSLLLLGPISSMAASATDQSLYDQLTAACQMLDIVTTDAFDTQEIHRTYRKKALQLHPDRYPGPKAEGERLFKALNNAHALVQEHIAEGDIKEILSTPPEPTPQFAWRSYSEPVPTAESYRPVGSVELYDKLYNASLLLSVHMDTTLEEIRKQCSLRVQSNMGHDPLPFAQRVRIAMLYYARDQLLEHYACLPWVLSNWSTRPVNMQFSVEFMNAATHMVEHSNIIWQPTVDYLRCYRWRCLIEDIRACVSPELIASYLYANPYLSPMHVAYEQNPYLQDISKRGKLALSAAHLSISHLVNMNNGRTDPLSEVYYTLENIGTFSDSSRRLSNLQGIARLLIGFGAVARFYP
jgi:hypothetical protein